MNLLPLKQMLIIYYKSFDKVFYYLMYGFMWTVGEVLLCQVPIKKARSSAHSDTSSNGGYGYIYWFFCIFSTYHT